MMTMMTHLNKFVANATLMQFYVTISDKLITGNFIVKIDDCEINVLYYIDREYNSNFYNNFINVIPSLIPVRSSCIEINNEKIFVKGNDKLFSALLLAGSIKYKNDKICFYGKVLELIKADKKNYLNIMINGVWIDNNNFLNIYNNIPIIFHIKNTSLCSNKNVQILYLKYNSGFTNSGNIINYQSDPELTVEKSIDTQEQLSQSLLADFMVEWEIRNANSRR